MDTFQLNGYYCGVVTTERGTKPHLEKLKKLWTQEGRICWISCLNYSRNQQCPNAE